MRATSRSLGVMVAPPEEPQPSKTRERTAQTLIAILGVNPTSLTLSRERLWALVGSCVELDFLQAVQVNNIGSEKRDAGVLLKVDHLDSDTVPASAPDVVDGETQALAAEALVDLDLRW